MTSTVSICCITYNHEFFIRDAIRGFINQKTSFPFEILIHDDASTDGTAEIIKLYEEKYPDIIKPIYQKENQYSQGRNISLVYQFPRARGKYIALCEGDDYWTDPYKLQKQVDFLEANTEYGLVGTDFDILHQSTGKIERSLLKNQPMRFPIYKNLEDFLLAAGFMAPCTWLCRREFLPKNIITNYSDVSFAWLLEIFANSKVAVIPDTTSVYRKLPESASHSKSVEARYKRETGILKIQLDYLNKYGLPGSLRTKVLRKHYHIVLPSIIALNKDNEISQAKNFIPFKERNIRDHCLFFIYKFPLGGSLIKLYYWIRDSL